MSDFSIANDCPVFFLQLGNGSKDSPMVRARTGLYQGMNKCEFLTFAEWVMCSDNRAMSSLEDIPESVISLAFLTLVQLGKSLIANLFIRDLTMSL